MPGFLRFSLTALYTALLAAPAIAAGPVESGQKSATIETKMVKSDIAPDGFVLVEDFVTVDLKQLPVDLLRAAESDFDAKNFGEAAGDLRAAGRVLRLEAKQAKAGNTHLMNAAADLGRLASDVKNQVTSGKDSLQVQLARALYHVAEHHRLQARRQWELKQYHAAGDDLRASAVATEMAAQWTDREIASSSRTAIEKARTVASQLTLGQGWSPADVTAALDGLDGPMSKIAGRVMPSSDKAKAGEAGESM